LGSTDFDNFVKLYPKYRIEIRTSTDNKALHNCGDGEKLISLLYLNEQKHFHLITSRKSFLTDKKNGQNNYKYCEDCETRYYNKTGCKCNKLALCPICNEKEKFNMKVIDGKIERYSKCCGGEIQTNAPGVFACNQCNSIFTEHFNSVHSDLDYTAKGELYFKDSTNPNLKDLHGSIPEHTRTLKDHIRI